MIRTYAKGAGLAGLRRQGVSLSALAAFEAAARLSGFTRAAEEMGITQAAVSRQIKQLETDLGVALFTRGHRRVDLTPAGLVLSRAMTGAFEQVIEALDQIRAPRDARTVTLGATLAFMHFWLLPRLPAFRAAHPDVNLRLVSQDTGFDLRRDPVDLLVVYGRPPFDGGTCVAEMPDRVLPVCAPDLARRGLGLHALPLIGCEWVEPSWLSWRKWAQLAGLPPLTRATALRFSHYTDAIYSAIAGEGVALGWEALVRAQIAQGRLVALPDGAVIPEERHCLVLPASRSPGRAARLVADWLAEAMQTDTPPPHA